MEKREFVIANCAEGLCLTVRGASVVRQRRIMKMYVPGASVRYMVGCRYNN